MIALDVEIIWHEVAGLFVIRHHARPRWVGVIAVSDRSGAWAAARRNSARLRLVVVAIAGLLL
jgi:hypothetical protein